MRNQLLLASITVTVTALSATKIAPAYDPLVPVSAGPGHEDWLIKDDTRSREIPIRVYLPHDPGPSPIVLFSHGLGGSREGSAYLGQYWSSRGYVVVFLQHPGSDTSVWEDKPRAERLAAMKQAASPQNLLLRVKDVPAVLDQLDRWNATKGHELCNRLDLKRVGMSGHSFGAVTAQAVSGQSLADSRPFTDPRIKAAVMMSPSGPRHGGDPKKSFEQVSIPWMLLTGTHDDSPIGGVSAADRLVVFPVLPPGGKYELVLDQAEHSAFTDRSLPGDALKRNPNHHRAILAVTTAFWDAYLRDNAEAKQWLDGDDVRKVLDKSDKWRKN